LRLSHFRTENRFPLFLKMLRLAFHARGYRLAPIERHSASEKPRANKKPGAMAGLS
jgi:hypothetical protein